jgi:hypothetical protein
MAKEYKPGFVYIKSEILKQEIAMSIKTGRVYCEDKVRYSPQEIDLFRNADAEIDLFTHLVKKVFEGEVVKVERDIRGNGQAKPTESGAGNNTSDNTSSGKEIPDANGNGAGGGDRELDIY